MPTSELYLASVDVLRDNTKPDVVAWAGIYNPVVSHNVPLIDRSELISSPYHFKLYPEFKMPSGLGNFNMSYDDCCNNRVLELLEKSKQENKPLLVFYSGGIDSTLILVSILRTLTKQQIKDHVVVACSMDSIAENANFYYNHVITNFKLVSSENFSSFISDNYITVGGEHNDQLFGSDLVVSFCDKLNIQNIFKPYKDGFIRDGFLKKRVIPQSANKWFDLLVHHAEQSPCEIKTNFQFLWWLNFNFKWQSVFFRMLMRVNSKNQPLINQDFVSRRFIHFYSSTEFQKWSMLNTHLKIKNTWSSYKFVAKESIFSFTKDENYFNNKVKKGSLSHLFRSKKTPVGLTTNYEYLYSIDKEKFYNNKNSFLEGV